MKRNGNAARAALIVATCAIIGFVIGIIIGRATRKPKDGEYSVTVCTTTDVHGAYFDRQDGNTSLSNVSTFIRGLRDKGTDPILIDCGDALQGDNAAYYYNYVDTKSEHVFASIAKYLKYDVLVVGNHDIEAGPAVYNRMKKAFPRTLLAANAVDTAGGRTQSHFAQYKVIRRDGLKIAVIGMTNANIKSWLPEEKWKGMNFIGISAVAGNIVAEIQRRVHPDAIILAIHSGFGTILPSQENEAYYIAKHVKGVDIVICGHDHKTAIYHASQEDGRLVNMINAGTKAQQVGIVELKFNVKNHKVTSVTSVCDMAEMTDYAPDEEYNKTFAKQFEAVRNFENAPMGQLTDDLDFKDAADGPSAYVNLIHTVQMDASGADISFAAPLSTTGHVEKGDITVRELAQIYKYENQLYVVRMTGKQVRDYLEFSYDNWINGTAPAYNFDAAAGIIYEVSRNAEKGSRVNVISMADGSAFDPEKSYTVAMTSYRASGGGNHLVYGAGINPSKLETVEKYDDIRSLIGTYIREHGSISPAVPDNWKWVE